MLFFLFCSLVAPAQKQPLSTLTRSPAVCSALAGSSSRRPFRSAPAPSRPSTLRYTPPLPPPPRPHRRRRPPCLTHWPIPHLLPLPCWLRATASLSTTACSSPRACPPTSAKVSSPARAHPGLFQFYVYCCYRGSVCTLTRVRINFPQRFGRHLRRSHFSGSPFTQTQTDTHNCYHGNCLCDIPPPYSLLHVRIISAWLAAGGWIITHGALRSM